MKQKIIKVGNSAAVLIPKQTMKEKNLKVGDEVTFQLQDAAVSSSEYGASTIPGSQSKAAVSPDLRGWLDEFLKEYKPVLEKLSRM